MHRPADGQKANSALAIGTTLRHLKAMLSWGVDQGMLPAVPKMTIPRVGGARARAVSGEEFERVLTVVRRGFRSGNVGNPYRLSTYVSGGQGSRTLNRLPGT